MVLFCGGVSFVFYRENDESVGMYGGPDVAPPPLPPMPMGGGGEGVSGYYNHNYYNNYNNY